MWAKRDRQWFGGRPRAQRATSVLMSPFLTFLIIGVASASIYAVNAMGLVVRMAQPVRPTKSRLGWSKAMWAEHPCDRECRPVRDDRRDW